MHHTMRTTCTFLLACLFLPVLNFSQSAADLEDLEKVSQKGFFKSYFSGFFKNMKKTEPFSMSGGIGFDSRFYSAWDIDPRQPRQFYVLNAQTNFNLYKINIPFSALLTFSGLQYTVPGSPGLREKHREKLNRIGLSPHYRWLTLHAGHRNLSFSRFTLNNLTFLGGGVEANPGKVRVGAMYGRLAKAEPVDLSLFELNVPVYKRLGYSVKVGYGTDSDFLDVIFLNAWDDPNSLTFTTPQAAFAARNAVVGVNARKTLFGKFQAFAELARSATTRDINAARDESITAPFPFSGIEPTVNSSFSDAFDGGLDYNGGKFGCGVQYTRIDPDYTTFGAYFFNNDIENFLGKGNLSLLKGRLSLNGSLGVQRDNLNDLKPTTIRRVIGSGNANLAPGKIWNLGLNYSNYSSNIQYVLNPDLDSLNVVVVTQDMGAVLTVNLPASGKNKNTINLIANLQDITDDVINPTTSSEAQMFITALIYSWTAAEKGLSLSANVNYNHNNLPSIEMSRWGMGVGVNKQFLKNKISSGLNLGIFRNQMTGMIDQTATTMQVNARLNYQISRAHGLQFNAILLNKNAPTSPTTGQGGFTEMTANIGYRYNFQYNPFKKEQTDAKK